MRKDQKDHAANRLADAIYWASIWSLMLAIITSGTLLWGMAYAGGIEFDPPTKRIDCYANPQVDLIGWKRVDAVDRYRIPVLVGEGKAKMRHETSLLCQNTEGGKVTDEFIVYEWWYQQRSRYPE